VNHLAAGLDERDESDTKTQRAVERNLQIVGDAAHKLTKRLEQAHAHVPWSTTPENRRDARRC
jgi:uncharacterized protein with HEPN domain